MLRDSPARRGQIMDLPILLADEPGNVSEMARPNENTSPMVHGVLVEDIPLKETVKDNVCKEISKQTFFKVLTD